ncbi:hypothetical protein LshimejAT787_0601600 [Lyophyllum shimeji]|uniref:F-box domain-containing protein n=1 Tax=Lyophyllum shimeji TaxID=47721 RepID=A0A9P3PN96_LYOSH|nr:hypothetical protein LshimejAT787_0601600 [Lyophyllum shimeji]
MKQKAWPLSRAPDKALREILKRFGTADLFRLALVSKRLHCLALPIIFRRHGFTEETQTIRVSLPRDLVIGGFIDALRIALSMCVKPAVSLLRVDFGEPHLPTDFGRIFDVISKLSVIHEVVLAFEDPNATHAADEERWASIFEMLCTALKTKSCTRLQVSRKSHGDIQVYHVLVTERRPYPESRGARSLGLMRHIVGLPSKTVNTSRVHLIKDPSLQDTGMIQGRRLALYSLEVNHSKAFFEEAFPIP